MNTTLHGALFGIAIGALIGGSESFHVCLSIAFATLLICRTIRPISSGMSTGTTGGAELGGSK